MEPTVTLVHFLHTRLFLGDSLGSLVESMLALVLLHADNVAENIDNGLMSWANLKGVTAV